jgi:hypothetical protein
MHMITTMITITPKPGMTIPTGNMTMTTIMITPEPGRSPNLPVPRPQAGHRNPPADAMTAVAMAVDATADKAVDAIVGDVNLANPASAANPQPPKAATAAAAATNPNPRHAPSSTRPRPR